MLSNCYRINICRRTRQHRLITLTSVMLCLLVILILLYLEWKKYSPYVLKGDPLMYIELDNNSCQHYAKFDGRRPVKRTPLNSSGLLRLSSFSGIRLGGTYIPVSCDILYKVAIIIPYRDRRDHLYQYLYNVVPKLKKQGIYFTIFVVEQAAGSRFNRGLMRNIGFQEARKIQKFDCYVFNDVDTIPEDDRNVFKCNNTYVRHLVSGVNRYNYGLLYPESFGGIVAFNEKQFTEVNGYTNILFEWGGEDDDLFQRVVSKSMLVERTKYPFGVVTTLGHTHEEIKTSRCKLFKTVKYTTDHDGLNSLMYELLAMEQKSLYTWIYVRVNETNIKNSYFRELQQLRSKGLINSPAFSIYTACD